MANTKISELPAATTLTGAETSVVVQGGTTKRTTAVASAVADLSTLHDGMARAYSVHADNQTPEIGSGYVYYAFTPDGWVDSPAATGTPWDDLSVADGLDPPDDPWIIAGQNVSPAANYWAYNQGTGLCQFPRPCRVRYQAQVQTANVSLSGAHVTAELIPDDGTNQWVRPDGTNGIAAQINPVVTNSGSNIWTFHVERQFYVLDKSLMQDEYDPDNYPDVLIGNEDFYIPTDTDIYPHVQINKAGQNFATITMQHMAVSFELIG